MVAGLEGGLKRTMEGICRKCGGKVEEVIRCARCGDLFCEMHCAPEEDVECAFDVIYSCPHCGDVCPQCRDKRDASIGVRYCKKCFADLLWWLHHRFFDEVGANLYWIFYAYCIKDPTLETW